jgi:hypothetical protein
MRVPRRQLQRQVGIQPQTSLILTYCSSTLTPIIVLPLPIEYVNAFYPMMNRSRSRQWLKTKIPEK